MACPLPRTVDHVRGIVLLPKAAIFHLPPATHTGFSESSPNAAYKVFLPALPYLRHATVMM
jgi:hypothetical protein